MRIKIALIALLVLFTLVLAQAQIPLSPNYSARTQAQVNGAVILGGVTTTSTAIAAQGAGVSLYIYQAECVNSSASTVTVGRLLQGTTVLAYIPCPAASTVGSVTNFNPPLPVAANTALGVAVTVAATTAYISVHGFSATR